jgi:hypothetical protein
VDERGAVLFEAPGRTASTLGDLAAACGPGRRGAVCRELTKLHEQIARGSLEALAAQAKAGTIPARGEVVIVVGWRTDGDRAATEDDGRQAAIADARAAVERLVADGIPRGEGRRVRRRRPATPRVVCRSGRRGAVRVHARGRGSLVSTAHATPSRVPVLGVLSPIARVAVLATLAASVAAIVLDVGLGAEGATVFVVAAIAILGLAWVVGLSTERLGALTGPQVGGILNATFGNIAELIIAFFALQAGLLTVVKASLTGSIIGNLLLVLGAAVLAGGLRNGIQTFSQRIAGSNAALLVLAATGLFIPAVFAASGSASEGTRVEESVLVAGVLIVGYALSLVWQFTNPEATTAATGVRGPRGPACPPGRRSRALRGGTAGAAVRILG